MAKRHRQEKIFRRTEEYPFCVSLYSV